MGGDNNKPTTQNQKILITAISVVFVLLVAQLLVSGNNSNIPDDRASCLDQGFIWSQSTGQCYGTSGDTSLPANTEAVTLSIDESDKANGVTITLRSIVSDDRCPLDAQCVQAGSVTAEVVLEQDGLREEPILRSDSEAYRFAGRDILLQAVSPQRTADTEIDPDGYELTFWVQYPASDSNAGR